MSVWSWIHEFAEQAEADGDQQRMRLYELQRQAFQHGKGNPELMLAAIEEGRSLAQMLGESWWVLHFDHWRLQCYMHYLLDYRPVLDLAVRAALEARKPAYAQLPQRICLHEDLIYAYLGADPLGHADAITQALDFMRQEVSEDLECRYCVQNCRTEFALIRGQLDEAEESARNTLDMADEDPSPTTGDHHAVFAYGDLCTVAVRRQDWESLRAWAEAGEAVARSEEEHRKLAEFLLLQGILAWREGEAERAEQLHRHALARVRRVKALPGPSYHDALCAYHEASGRLDEAVKSRRIELEQVAGRGRHHDECRCRAKLCRLLAQAGEPLDSELAAARESAARLRDPSPHLTELDQIARG